MNVGYTIPARLYPALLVILPAALALVAWFPNESASWALLSGLGLGGALTMLFSQIGRDLGKNKEPDLWLSWGGKPTTQLLRHRDRHLDDNTKRRYYARLAKIVTNITLPTAEEELQDPAAADAVYDSCVRYLIANTRDTKAFPLLFKENVSYGFRRNLWGMRPAGTVIAALGLALSAIPIALYWSDGFRFTASIATVVNAVLLVLWLQRINSDWVRVPAYRYAEELLSATERANPADV